MEKSVLYGSSAQEWLDRWDNGETVWSIEMGGMGPGYEQAIQITMAELLRFILLKNYDLLELVDSDKWKVIKEEIYNHSLENEVIKNLGGITGAQYGAALNLAFQLYRRGPVAVMADEDILDRHIQVSRIFP